MTPYWLDEPAPALPPGNGGPVDVGIVGAGITGCACALALAEAGLRVRVVDERRVAEGASGRNGGFALRGMAGPYDQVVADLGRERALALWRWTEAELARDGRARGRRLPAAREPRLAADAEEREDLRDEIEALWADGIEAEWIDAPGGVARRPLHRCDPPPDGRRAAAGTVGAAPRGRAPSGRRRDRRGSPRDGPAELEAETVVIATDGYPSGLLGELEGLIVPTRGQVIATEPLSERSSRRRTTAATASTTGTRPRTAGSSPAASATCRSTGSSRTRRRSPTTCRRRSRRS